MRIRLKGLNSITKRLADGSTKTYWYAWKGGPPLEGEPGTPEFIASYNKACERKAPPAKGTLQTLIDYFQTTSEFTRDIKERTRADYIRQIGIIEKKFGDFPLSRLSEPRARGIFKDWRDKLADKSERQADYAWTVLARILSIAVDRGKIKDNPCKSGGRLYNGNRADKVWTAADESNFLQKAPEHLRLPLLLALWTGQRQGDLLRLAWSGYDGTHIRLRQGKTGRRVVIPVGAPLKAALDTAVRRSPIMLTNLDGQPWTKEGFRAMWAKARRKAGVVGVTFNDLRGTAVTRLALAGCTVPEIATITGHSLADVQAILDSNYLHRDVELAETAIHKLETRNKNRNKTPN